MKKIKFPYRLFKKSLKKNRYFSIITLLFIAVAALTVAIALIKTATSESEYVYAKVKISQGFWWAATRSPSVWFVNSLKAGEVESGLLGRPTAEILEVKYYPTISPPKYETQYEIFLTLKLAVSYNDKTQKYLFKRSAIGVGSPIELEFPSTQISGTVIEISKRPFRDEYIEKDIILTKRLAFPWEFETIKIGDTLFDGKEVVFEITGKQALNTSLIDVSPYGNINLSLRDPRRFIRVYGKIKLKNKDGRLIFGEEQVIAPGSEINLATKNFVFDEFVVQEIK